MNINLTLFFSIFNCICVCFCQRFGQPSRTLFRAPSNPKELRTHVFHKPADIVSEEENRIERIKRSVISTAPSNATLNSNYSSIVSFFLNALHSVLCFLL